MRQVVSRVPETKSAYLPNSYGKATLHVFERAEIWPSLRGEAKPEPGIALLYKCQETGEVRQWGLEYLKGDVS